ncbi:MAG: sulfatase-like hydrolase/transferase [Terracidiphilus sp.]
MIKRIAQAWGFASIALLPSYVDLTSSLGDARMHVPWPLTRMALAQLVDLAIVASLFAGLMALLRHLRAWTRIRWVLLALFPVYLLARNLNLVPFHVPGAAVLALSAAWAAVLALLVFRAPAIASQLYRFASAVLTGFVVFAAVVSWQLAYAALWRPAPHAFAHPISSPPPNRPRLVWIVLDELAYQPVFEARDPSVELPNFDRLRNQGTLYTQVIPVAYHTTLVIPSLLLGQKVTSSTYTADNRFLVRTADSPHWQPFDVSASLFGVANRLGVNTSIVGWYVAYCPIFAGAAKECFWTDDDTELGNPPSRNAGFAEDVWFPLRIMAEQLLAPRMAWADNARWLSQGHIATVKDLSQHALAALATTQADIVYLHIPAPHPPAFWNRRTHSFAVGGSYLDSLDYSDRLLGQMLDILEAQPRWASTTLIVQGDHSWRTRIWRATPGWSAEDERISHGGQWDPRPVLLIHAAGQKTAETVTTPTSLMFVHDYIAAHIQSLAK